MNSTNPSDAQFEAYLNKLIKKELAAQKARERRLKKKLQGMSARQRRAYRLEQAFKKFNKGHSRDRDPEPPTHGCNVNTAYDPDHWR